MTERHRLRRAALCLLLPGITGAWQTARAAPSFDEVAPILASRCVVCHAGPSAPSGLRLDTLAGLLAGSQKGAVVKSGDPATSELVRRIKGIAQPRMPLTGPPFLSESDVALIEAWVAGGLAPGSGKAPAAVLPTPPGPNETVTYAHVAPIFAQRCVKCHTEAGLMGAPPEGFRTRTLAELLDFSDRARIVPGNPGASELLRRIKGQSLPRMPFDGPPWLQAEEIALIERWIANGARDAAGKPAPIPVGARVRLEGTLTGRWELDGSPVRVDSGTRIDKSPGVGSRVELRGVVEPDGQIAATRLRRR